MADLRAIERLPRQVSLAELRSNSALRKVKFLKNFRLIISPVSDCLLYTSYDAHHVGRRYQSS